jgi:hypothetical protein
MKMYCQLSLGRVKAIRIMQRKLISVPKSQHCAENAWISVVLPVLVQEKKLFIIWK